jgi:hypothetical protein
MAVTGWDCKGWDAFAVSDSVCREFRAAAEYYEHQHGDLGSRFTNAVEAAVAHITEAPS